MNTEAAHGLRDQTERLREETSVQNASAVHPLTRFLAHSVLKRHGTAYFHEHSRPRHFCYMQSVCTGLSNTVYTN